MSITFYLARIGKSRCLQPLVVCFALLISLWPGHLSAQYVLSTLENVPQIGQINPAMTPDVRYYISIPVASGIHASLNTQGFTLDDMGYEGFFGGKLDYDMARRQISDVNLLRSDARIDLLNIGMGYQSSFFSLNFTERLVGESMLPVDLFRRLADEETGGMAAGRWYDLSALSVQGLHFRELGLGYTHRGQNGLNLGIRLKFLLGQEAIFSENTGLLLIEDDQGRLVSEQMLELRSAGFNHFSGEEGFYHLFSSRNAGVALDAGIDYQYNENWSFFAAVNDLGNITWRNSLNLRNIDGTFNNLEDKIDRTIDALTESAAEDTRTFRTTLPMVGMAGARYQFNNKHTVTAMTMPHFYEYGNDWGFALAYQLPVGKCFNFSGSYAYFNNTYNNAGAGFSVQLGPVQWYAAADNILAAFSPDKYNNVHIQTGINLVWRKPEATPEPPVAEVLEVPEEVSPEPSVADLGEYFTLSSSFRGTNGEQVEAIYVDIYRYEEGGEKQLIHTSRYPADRFEVTLFQVSNLHEMSVRAYGFEPMVFQFIPESRTLHRDFRLNSTDIRSGN